MNKEDILSATGGWIKISIKFSGVCVYCKQRLSSGEYGYWSKGSKSILHESCYDSLLSPSSANGESSSDNSGSMTLDGAINKNIGLQKKDGNTENNTDHVDLGSRIGDRSSSGINSNILGGKREKKVKCFICNSCVDFNNELVISLLKLSEGYNSNSDILYCFDCLENISNDSYENYERRFVNAFMDFK